MGAISGVDGNCGAWESWKMEEDRVYLLRQCTFIWDEVVVAQLVSTVTLKTDAELTPRLQIRFVKPIPRKTEFVSPHRHPLKSYIAGIK